MYSSVHLIFYNWAGGVQGQQSKAKAWLLLTVNLVLTKENKHIVRDPYDQDSAIQNHKELTNLPPKSPFSSSLHCLWIHLLFGNSLYRLCSVFHHHTQVELCSQNISSKQPLFNFRKDIQNEQLYLRQLYLGNIHTNMEKSNIKVIFY